MSTHNKEAAERNPVVPMPEGLQVTDTESARHYLIRYMAANFKDRTFMRYIRDELAGDFAYNLARALTASEAPDAEQAPTGKQSLQVEQATAGEVPIQTWQQRCNWMSDEPATKLMVEAMKAEIADLRAALSTPPAVPPVKDLSATKEWSAELQARLIEMAKEADEAERNIMGEAACLLKHLTILLSAAPAAPQGEKL